MRCNFYVDQGAIFFAMSPNARDRWGRPICFNVRQKRRNIFRGADVFDGHSQKFSSGITVMPNCCFIDREEPQRRGIVYPHREWIALKSELILTLAVLRI